MTTRPNTSPPSSRPTACLPPTPESPSRSPAPHPLPAPPRHPAPLPRPPHHRHRRRRRRPAPRISFFGGSSPARASSSASGWTYGSYRRALRTPLPTADEVRAVGLAMLGLWRARSAPQTFDSALEWSEWAAGISRRRRELVGGAPGGNWAARALRSWRGERPGPGRGGRGGGDGVDGGSAPHGRRAPGESAAGTGRNVARVHLAAGPRVRSVTLVDASAGLLEGRARALARRGEAARRRGYASGLLQRTQPARHAAGALP